MDELKRLKYLIDLFINNGYSDFNFDCIYQESYNITELNCNLENELSYAGVILTPTDF